MNYNRVSCAKIKLYRTRNVGWLFDAQFLTPTSTLFQLYTGGEFYWRKPKYRINQPTCRKSLISLITQRCIKYTTSLAGSNSQLTDSAVRCKSNYHAITTTTAQDRNVNDIRYPYHIGIQSSAKASSSVNMVRVLIVQSLTWALWTNFY